MNLVSLINSPSALRLLVYMPLPEITLHGY